MALDDEIDREAGVRLMRFGATIAALMTTATSAGVFSGSRRET